MMSRIFLFVSHMVSVFIYVQNSHIHAYVYPDNWRAIDKEVVEGNVYVIENFQVRETIGKLKPVSTRLCIRLLSSTVIQPVEDDVMIPKHKFEFMDMGDLLFECQRLTENQNPEFAYGNCFFFDTFS